MARPAIVAHGGAGAGPERRANLEPAMKVGRAILEAGGSAIEAAVEACVLLEDDPVFNAGTGSVVRTDGSVLTDASLQTGDGRLGFVIAMEDTPNPIRICADLLDEEINGLAGPGARRWADARGHLKANVIGRPPKDEIGDVVDVGPKPAEIVGDTVGVIARDSQGNIAAATSTGGCSHRPAGRVGDVPLPGSGYWVNGAIAVAATGIGEAITIALLSKRVHERISASRDQSVGSLEAAMQWGIDNHIAAHHQVGLIALCGSGIGTGVANTDMPWLAWQADS